MPMMPFWQVVLWVAAAALSGVVVGFFLGWWSCWVWRVK